MLKTILPVAACSLLLAGCANTKLTPMKDPSAPTVLVDMTTSKGVITIELDRVHAPISVANFLAYADRGAYDGTIFHRVVENFVIQGGGYTTTLTERAKHDKDAGHPDTPIMNEWQNGLKNTRGTIAMARDEQPNTATREFYINVQDNPKLDTARSQTGNAGYAVFGQVVSGMDVVDAIRQVPTTAKPSPDVTDGSLNNVPVETVEIKSVKRRNR